jgi:putative flippase GtrA
MPPETIERPRPKRATGGLGRFLTFGLVGLVGLVVDVGVLTLMIDGFGFGPYVARLVSYFAAATTTWALNRRYTFDITGSGSLIGEWGRFTLVNGVGGIANYGVFALLVATSPFIYQHPVVAVVIGAGVGWVFNYHASKRLVFDQAKGGETDGKS